MDKILEEAQHLNKILVDSDVYQNYLYAKKNLDEESEKLLIEYKKLYCKYSNGDMEFEQEKILSSIYSKLMLNKNSRLFIQNELALTQLIKEIYSKLIENIEVDLFE